MGGRAPALGENGTASYSFCRRLGPRRMQPAKVHPYFEESAHPPHTVGLWWSCAVPGSTGRPPRCLCAQGRRLPPHLPLGLTPEDCALFGSPWSQKPAEEKACSLVPFLSLQFSFPFTICLLSLSPGTSLLWLTVLKGYTLYLKTSWVTPW